MDKLYTIIEVANKLNLSDKTLRRWEEAGRFTPSRTLGNQRRYSLEDLQILDAIKHGTINEQKDLLTIEQAGKLAGVSPTTILRWENDGKIHPLITSGNTYYPRQKLIEKLEELKKIYVESQTVEPTQLKSFEPYEENVSNSTGNDPYTIIGSRTQESEPEETQILQEKPKLSSFQSIPITTTTVSSSIITPYITNVFLTVLLILSYHLIFNSTGSLPNSPQLASNQNISISSDPTLDLLKTILDPTGAITTTNLTSKIGLISPILSLSPSSAPAKPNPGTIYYDAVSQSLKVYKGTGWFELAPSTNLKIEDATLISSSAILPKGKNQVSFTHEKITPITPITVTFTADYAPAKKYWITTDQGSFTLYTDFPVSADSSFNYNFITPNSTISATPKF